MRTCAGCHLEALSETGLWTVWECVTSSRCCNPPIKLQYGYSIFQGQWCALATCILFSKNAMSTSADNVGNIKELAVYTHCSFFQHTTKWLTTIIATIYALTNMTRPRRPHTLQVTRNGPYEWFLNSTMNCWKTWALVYSQRNPWDLKRNVFVELVIYTELTFWMQNGICCSLSL